MLESERESAITQINNWINQFDKFDHPCVQNMLNDLIMVSYSSFEKNISKIILDISKQYNKIALFPVEELSQENVKSIENNNNSNEKYLRRMKGSSGQIDYFLKRLGEQNQKKLIACPNCTSMISEKIGAIVYVDDFIGSGKRVITFWKNFINKKIKSWLSYCKCDIYFVAYAVMDAGIKNILKNCRGSHYSEFKFFLKNPTFKNTIENEIRRLCDRYVLWNDKNKYGYGNCLTNIIFEWKCPNNTPALLWMEKKGWKTLLKNRNIDKDLFVYLQKNHNIRIVEKIWNAGQYQIALSIINNLNTLSQDDINFICFLSLIAKRMSPKNIKPILGVNDEQMSRLFAKAENVNAITYGKISDFGKALLESFRKIPHPKDTLHVEEKNIIYIPTQYGGYSRI